MADDDDEADDSFLSAEVFGSVFFGGFLSGDDIVFDNRFFSGEDDTLAWPAVFELCSLDWLVAFKSFSGIDLGL